MTIEELLEQCIQKNLIDLTISGLKKKNEELPVKIKVRPVAMKDNIEYQSLSEGKYFIRIIKKTN